MGLDKQELIKSISVCFTRLRLAGWGTFDGLGIFVFLICKFVGRFSAVGWDFEIVGETLSVFSRFSRFSAFLNVLFGL